MATDLMQTGKDLLPKIGGIGSTVVTMIAWVMVLVIMAIIICIVLYFYLQSKKYKYKLVIFERINNVWVDTMKDKGCEIKFGNIGITVMYFKKMKRHEPFPKIQSGYRKFYFKKLPDGTLMNFKLEDHDSLSNNNLMEMNQAMLYHHTGINKGLKDRYEKEGIWAKYGTIMVSVGFVIMIGVLTWLLFDKWIALAQVTNAGVESAGQVMDKANTILAHLDNALAHSGSGYVSTIVTNGTG